MEQAAVLECAAGAAVTQSAAAGSTRSRSGIAGTDCPGARRLRQAKQKPTAPADREGGILDPACRKPGLDFGMTPLNTKKVRRASCPEHVLLVAAQHNLRIDNEAHRHRAEIDSSRTHLNLVLVGAATPAEVVAEAAQAMADIEFTVKRRDQIMGIKFVFQAPPGWDRAEFWQSCLEHLRAEFECVLHAAVHRDQDETHMHVLVLPIKDKRWVGDELTQGGRFGWEGRRRAFMQHMRTTLGLRPDRPAPAAPASVPASPDFYAHKSLCPPTSTPADFILGTPKEPSAASPLVTNLMALVKQRRSCIPPLYSPRPASARPPVAEAAGSELAVVRGDKQVVALASPLTDAGCAAIRSPKPEPVALMLSSGHPQRALDTATARTCRACTHYGGGYRNCVEPVAAGLASKFSIVWAQDGHATTCPAFQPKESHR